MEAAVIYARFSSYGQNEQSIEAQVRICKEFAESKDLKVINVYPDKARTGTNDARPAFQKMISDAETGAFKYIIVYMFDRFARNRKDSLIYKEMLKDRHGIKVLSALEPIADDEGGEFYEMFLEWNAEKYSKRLSKRVKDGLDISAANGTYCGGTLIYGYRIDNEPVPGKSNRFIKRVIVNDEEAEIIRFAFSEYDKGTTKIEIADTLNKQGYRYHGKLFKGRTFDKWFVNRKYTGDFYFGGRHCTNMYPAIIEKDLFERVLKKMESNMHCLGGMQSANTPYLLTGKLFCGECGTEMTADGGTSKSGNQHHYYICNKRRKKQCEKHREQKDKIEEYATACVVAYLKDEERMNILIDDTLEYYEKKTEQQAIKSITTRIANTKSEMEELTTAFVKAKSHVLQNSIETKINELQILLDDLNEQKAILELERGFKITKSDLSCFITELIKGDVKDKSYQKKIIDNLVDKVYVSDEDTIVYFNINAGAKTDPIYFDEVQDDLSNPKSVQTQLPPSRQN